MIQLIFIILFSYSSATNNSFLGYDFGQSYSRIRLYEYVDYTDVIFLKFNIYAPTISANWSINIHRDGKCADYLTNIHFDLQHGAYPLIAPKNETFPDMYITNRHDLILSIFNQTLTNETVQLKNPLRGTWFAMAFIERLSKTSSSNCNISLTTWLDYQAIPVSLTLTLNQPIQMNFSNNLTSIYASYYTSPGNSQISLLSEWSTNCDIIILARINGLPSFSQYDYQIVCQHGLCSLDLDSLSAFLWIYFQISINNQTCLNSSIHGSILIQSTEYLFQLYSTRRIMSNNYYDFLYIPEYSNNSITEIIFNEYNSSIYSYEFIVDDRNLGGTIHIDFKSQIKSSNINISILGCLSKIRPYRYNNCEIDYQIFIHQNTTIVKSLPYPEMAFWYLTLESNCNSSKTECSNISISLIFQISSSKCTRNQCGTYGDCQIMISQQNIFSVCTCLAGYRGYGCTDSRNNYVWKYLPSVLFLTLSNLMFIPAIILAIYYRLYIEALVYFFNMFFSTFYHACDQEIRRFCIFKYDGLQLTDFIGSYSSFVITLITMSIISRSIKIFLFIFGILICIVLNARDRFDNKQSIGLIITIFMFTISTWIILSIKKRRLQPNFKQLLCILPGILLSITGIVLFVFLETNDNYWYIHSLWHIFMATSILFFLPQKIKQNEQREVTNELNINTSNQLAGIINEGSTVRNDENDNHLM